MSLAALLIWVFSFFSTGPQGAFAQCHPVVENVQFDGDPSAEVSHRLTVMEAQDQAIRRSADEFDIAKAIEEDRLRREETMGYLQKGQVIYSWSLFSAALIFQHGDCPDHYRLAADLALRAHELNSPSAGWLYTAATDRYLLSIGQIQHYGTQYVADIENRTVLCPVKTTTTDEERATFGLMSLEELQAYAAEIDRQWPQDPPSLSPLLKVPFFKQIANEGVILWRCAH